VDGARVGQRGTDDSVLVAQDVACPDGAGAAVIRHHRGRACGRRGRCESLELTSGRASGSWSFWTTCTSPGPSSSRSSPTRWPSSTTAWPSAWTCPSGSRWRGSAVRHRGPGRRRSPVQLGGPTPPLELLMCASAAKANTLARERGWPGISAQAFGLKKQILAVGEVAAGERRRAHRGHLAVAALPVSDSGDWIGGPRTCRLGGLHHVGELKSLTRAPVHPAYPATDPATLPYAPGTWPDTVA